MSFEQRTLYDVCGEFTGSETNNRTILLGNHHDAWVFGAVDPISGSATMLEVIRALGKLKKDYGWQPKRKIVFCSWDGEEQGLIGSTWYGETNANTLDTETIAYLNLDVAVDGNSFWAAGSPSLLI